MEIIQDHTQPLRLSKRDFGRVLQPFLSEITVKGNLMQGSLCDISISILENFP